MKNEKCGIYAIRCEKSGKLYIGSSAQIYTRWSQHRRQLRGGRHHSYRLQRAWNKHGETLFTFLILEECSRDELIRREQWHIDDAKPDYNVASDVAACLSPEILAKRAASLRARAALITHCPKGHPYDEANTYRSRAGKRCRRCHADRVSAIYASETPEQREARRVRVDAAYKANYAKRRAHQNAYAAERRDEKCEYDHANREAANVRRNERRANEAPERREHRLRLKRESWLRNRV